MLNKKVDSNNFGVVVQVRDEVVSVVGLYSVGINEKVSFVDVNLQGMVRTLSSDNGGSVQICVLGNAWEIEPGMWVERIKQIMLMPISLDFISKIISPTGEKLQYISIFVIYNRIINILRLFFQRKIYSFFSPYYWFKINGFFFNFFLNLINSSIKILKLFIKKVIKHFLWYFNNYEFKNFMEILNNSKIKIHVYPILSLDKYITKLKNYFYILKLIYG